MQFEILEVPQWQPEIPIFPDKEELPVDFPIPTWIDEEGITPEKVELMPFVRGETIFNIYGRN